MTQHFSFDGLYTRKSFWLTQLTVFVAMVFGSVMLIGGAEVDSAPALITGLAVLFPSVWVSWAALAKRVRDTGNNAWLALLTAIPYVGIVPYLYFGFTSRSITHGTVETE